MAFISTSLSAQENSAAEVNSWINPASGNWDEASSWSLGLLPGNAQTVMITNSGWKAVAINPSTPVNFPDSMSVSNLTVSAPSNSLSTLLLNYAGTATPLRVLDGCTLGSNGTLANFESSFEVDSANGGDLFVDGGTFVQEGGLTVVNGLVSVPNGNFNATNANLTLGQLTVGSGAGSPDPYTPDAVFTQDGGSIAAQSIDIEQGGAYHLVSGRLYGINGTTCTGCPFVQYGGTNYGDITTRGYYYWLRGGMVQGNVLTAANGSGMTQDGGLLDMKFINVTGTTNWPVLAGSWFNGGTVHCGTLNIGGNGKVEMRGADFFVTNNFDLSGREYNGDQGPVIEHVACNLWAGNVYLPSMSLGQYAYFSQMGGSNEIRAGLSASGGQYSLYGGTLETTDTGVGAAATFAHGGGQHFVHGVLSITGTYSLNGASEGGCNLVCEGLYLRGALVMTMYYNGRYFDPAATFTNTGVLNLGGTISTELPEIEAGQVQLATNALIDLSARFPAVIRFQNSSALDWTAGALLVISNWSSSDHVFAGNDASGLTASQLQQVVFTNPAGFAPGTYPAQILSTGEIVPQQGTSTPGLVNSWINPTSGNWDEAANWSLGALPDSSQAVMITNSGWKAVAINPSTPVNFPGSMTVSNLTIRGATNTENVLLLNSFGTDVPLTVLNRLTLQDDGRIVNFNSGLVVQGGTITVTNSQIMQDGGFVRTTNAPMYLQKAEYDLTNGVFEGGQVSLGWPVSARFNQYGGAVVITSLSFGPSAGGGNSGGGTYALYGGYLSLPGGLMVTGDNNSSSSYLQAGGSNQTTQVLVEPGYDGASPGFELNGGLLADVNVNLFADNFGTATIEQNGGTHVVTNLLNISGGAGSSTEVHPATYSLGGGTLLAGSINLDATQGDALFVQSNGLARAGEIQAKGYWIWKSDLTLAGGTLSCSNLSLTNGSNLHQYGGAVIVSNSLYFGGDREPGPKIYSRYESVFGTLSASNIIVGGDWIIDDGAGEISNPGTCSLSHTLQIGNLAEQLGRFILASNATIDLAGSVSRLSFAKSSGESWAGGATLVVADWNGNPSGGGAEQLKFGTDQSGLTPAQLSQIRFSSGTNLYPAKILNTGEVVPDQAVVGPSVAFSQQGNNLVLTWPPGWSLQSATNVAGPYVDVPAAASPYTIDTTQAPQQFFRLRQ